MIAAEIAHMLLIAHCMVYIVIFIILEVNGVFETIKRRLEGQWHILNWEYVV
jgi:hypothetical protein